MSTDGMYIYHLGVIDYIQEYLWNKKVETELKKYKSDVRMISSVHPNWYCERFYEFMRKEVIIN